MERLIFSIALSFLLSSNIFSQQAEVMTLGTFHFAFPNQDIVQIDDDKQIDVLSSKYQKEIVEITDKIANFKPTIIAIEVNSSKQAKIDSIYSSYRNGKHKLTRSEHEQIGFRLAKQLQLKKIYCIDDWGRNYSSIDSILNNPEHTIYNEFMQNFYENPDSLLMYNRKHVYKTKGILEDLIEGNKPENHIKNLGNYLISIFKFETDDNPYLGADFTTGWWFNRNLRIFRNLQKIPASSNDRILVIYGSGHLNLLNHLIEASPEYNLVNTNSYLD